MNKTKEIKLQSERIRLKDDGIRLTIATEEYDKWGISEISFTHKELEAILKGLEEMGIIEKRRKVKIME